MCRDVIVEARDNVVGWDADVATLLKVPGKDMDNAMLPSLVFNMGERGVVKVAGTKLPGVLLTVHIPG
jgi:hypothetical protein